ncbi:hypothetical protein ACFYZB_28200 [Streptomyces sp. NPDC001852]|uniref:hypothetical protein n=1 Tax=Streptomyces sp. NPDC001852 TaxID=3364619 RepID=UPI00368F899C
MRTKTRRRLVAALLVGCCALVSCGTQRAGVAQGDSPAPRSSAADRTCDIEEGAPDTTDDDQGLPDTTSDDQELPDATSDDQGLPDTTSDDQGLPGTTSDDQGPAVDDTSEDGSGVPQAGPHRWFPMAREFRAYLTASASSADAAIAAHVDRVCVRMPGSDGRTEADVWVDYGVWDDDKLERAAAVFARWRQSVYGDRGHVEVLAPAKMNTERSW